jgi:hypothetical protein
LNLLKSWYVLRYCLWLQVHLRMGLLSQVIQLPML